MQALPQKIEKIEEEALRIVWEDGSASLFPFRFLRQNCPCAQCKDEWTGKRLLDIESVPQDLKGQRADLVGQYALQFLFSDGHSAGIYTFDMLKKIPTPASES
jgi:DUF971 family protein